MDVPAAVFLDVYETVLVCDFERHFHGLADAAGVDLAQWSSELEQHVPALILGHISITEAFARVLSSCGVENPGARGEDLALCDVELIIECSTLFPDVLPSIRRWRSLGVKVALVSNCVANTRPLLEAIGLSTEVDATVLSCEVGSAKPARQIYLAAGGSLGVRLEDTVFVDDHEQYCAGAETVGMQSVLIDRARTASSPAPTPRPIKSLNELDRHWTVG